MMSFILVFRIIGPGSQQGSDAAHVLVQAINQSYIDDTYTQLQFQNVNSTMSSKIGIFRPSSGIWSLDSNGNFAREGSDKSLSWGLPNDKPVVGKF